MKNNNHFKNQPKYQSYNIKSINRKALYTNLTFLVDVKFNHVNNLSNLSNVKGGSSLTKLTNLDLTNLDLANLDLANFSKDLLYNVINYEFKPVNITTLLNRYICKNNNILIKDLANYLQNLNNLENLENLQNLEKLNISDKSCLNTIDNLENLKLTFLPEYYNNILVIGNEIDYNHISSLYKKNSKKITLFNLENLENLNNLEKFDLIICCQYLYTITENNLIKLVQYIKKVINGKLIIIDLNINGENEILDLIYNLYTVLILKKTKRIKFNYVSKDTVLNYFNEFNIVNEVDVNNDDPTNLYFITLESLS
jgi:hypothetical protein